jgi:hypothetical protein
MEIIQNPDSKWDVVDANGVVLAKCETNAEAWRTYDRLASEPINRHEVIADWIFEKGLADL